jgi:hypothetical protein
MIKKSNETGEVIYGDKASAAKTNEVQPGGAVLLFVEVVLGIQLCYGNRLRPHGGRGGCLNCQSNEPKNKSNCNASLRLRRVYWL